ncbi:hypothetical protein B0J14DRAFT_6895 [Halenospora varia]|nr:hypothetical protein B0J14DRAFT_6895 [Halenospora varia]
METVNEALGVQLSSLGKPSRRNQEKAQPDALAHLVKPMDTNIGEEFNGFLSKMFDLSSRLNLHFFAMYGMVHRFEEKETNNVKKYNITKLRKAMEKELNQYTENAKSINENRCADAWINSVREMFVNLSFMGNYWARKVDAPIMRPPLTHCTSLEWLNWIHELQTLVALVPNIVLQAQTLYQRPVFNKHHIANLKIKVAFFDSILDRAYGQRQSPFGPRDPSIGFEINRLLMEKTGEDPGFKERDDEIASRISQPSSLQSDP